MRHCCKFAPALGLRHPLLARLPAKSALRKGASRSHRFSSCAASAQPGAIRFHRADGNCLRRGIDASVSSAGIWASPSRSPPAMAGRTNSLVAAPRKDFCTDTPQRGDHERASNAATLFRYRRRSAAFRLQATATHPWCLCARCSTTGKIPAGPLAARKERWLAGHNPNKSQGFPVKEPNGSRNLPVRFSLPGGKVCIASGSSNRVLEKTLDRQR